jgi:hydrogenase maturation factor
MTNKTFRLRAVLFDTGVLKDAHEAGDLLERLSGLSLKLGLISPCRGSSLEEALETIPGPGPDTVEVFIRPGAKQTHLDAALLSGGLQESTVETGEALLVSADAEILKAGRAAGMVTLALGPAAGDTPAADLSVSDLAGVFDVVRLGLPLAGGKFPNELLERHFTDFPFDDPSLIVQPAVGEDTAAVDIAGDEVLVLKSDPITFAADAMGQYAVLVNANDIATAGARPRWMLTTLLFPPGTTPSEVMAVMEELQQVSRRWGITLCGGHTEISDAVTRPVVVGVMAGTVTRAGLVDKSSMRPGDRVYLTKAVSVEGTSIIARELGSRLEKLGVSPEEVHRCRGFLKDISILAEAGLAARCQGVSAMHDVTEGGLSTALLELSQAGGHGIAVDMARIPVFEETRRLCRLLGIDPLGLIGSGSLLICCRPADADRLAADVQAAGIRITAIGEVTEGESGISAFKDGKPVPWPRFEVDEITRLF